MQSLSESIRNIEKAVSKTGLNVPLYYVENSLFYKRFINDLQKDLYAQLTSIDEAEIDRLFMFMKADTPLDVEIKTGFKSALMDFLSFLLKIGQIGGQYELDNLGIKGTFVMENKAVIKYFEDHNKLLIEGIDETSREWIADKLRTGKEQMLMPREIAETMRNEAKAISAMRAELITLTETANALSVTQKETALQNGIKEQVWRTSIDERVCPTCLPLDGAKVAIGNLYAGIYNHPPAHPRCRCYLEDVIPEDWFIPVKPWTGQ